jgi:hypothetical protein
LIKHKRGEILFAKIEDNSETVLSDEERSDSTILRDGLEDLGALVPLEDLTMLRVSLVVV